MPPNNRRANLLALGAIALWSSLAALGLALAHVPPFLLTALALAIGSTLSWPLALRQPRNWRVPARVLALGIYGLFGFHFLLFMALRLSPPVATNLVNYLWPLLMVLLAPLLLRGQTLGRRHLLAALLGFVGAALAIIGSATPEALPSAASAAGSISAASDASSVNAVSSMGNAGNLATSGAPPASPANPASAWGYVLALGSALVWASYSLATRALAAAGVHVATPAVGLFALASALLSLLCHLLWEPRTALSASDLGLLLLMGLGPMGAAFYLWDAALKIGDARQIGVLSYLTPLASTALLLLSTGRAWQPSLLLATALIVGAALQATRNKA